MTNPRLPAPHHWIDGFAAHLERVLVDATVDGVISGPGWLALRLGRRYLWLLARGQDRMAWLDDEPFPHALLDLMGRHEQSPFPAHLRSRRVQSVWVLSTAAGQADGLALDFGPGARHRLHVRWFPRPGALWVSDAKGHELARQGRMEGEELEARPAIATEFDADAHADACAAVLKHELHTQTERVLRQRLETDAKRAQRLVWTLQGELAQTEQDRAVRKVADVLAAHLHELRPGLAHVTLEGFEGETVEVELDPALPPHANLDRWYKRAGKAERKREQVVERLSAAQADLATALARADRLKALQAEDPSLTALVEWAGREGLDPVKTAPRPASERGRPDPERLPYWTFRIGPWEVRVGRTARDNDALTAKHSHGRDLWLHAQGVPGSHVILRTAGGGPVPADVVSDAARLAAQYSRARTSATVPVLVVERRYVRKPRKAPPGQVTVERAKTLFVEPGVPARCRRADADAEID